MAALLRLMACNPQSLTADYRADEISRAFGGVDIIGMSGTRVRMRGDAAHHRAELRHHTVIHFGRPGGKANAAASVAIALRRGRFRERHVVRVAAAGGLSQGRAGAVTISRGELQIKIVVQYVPSRVGTRYGEYKRVVDSLYEREVMACPYRVVPVLMGDSNSGLGLNSRGRPMADDGTVGRYRPERQNFSGDCLRSMMQRQHLCAANTFGRSGPTYVSHDGRASRIDYIILPRSALRLMRAC